MRLLGRRFLSQRGQNVSVVSSEKQCKTVTDVFREMLCKVDCQVP